MTGLLPLAVGLGMSVSLLMTEAFGLATGGLVVPGYVALLIDRPYELALLIASAAMTYGIVRGIEAVTILYGRRRTTLTLLVGYLTHMGTRALMANFLASREDLPNLLGGEAIGLVIPGLLAVWLARQGLLETLSALACATTLTRLMLIVLAGERIVP